MQARTENQRFSPPLPEAEVVKTAQSAWKIQSEGRNWIGGEAQVSLPLSLWDQFSERPDALVLLGYLQAAHVAHGGPFPVSPRAMAEAKSLDGWGDTNYATARDWLVENGFLVQLHKGGKRIGDASLFTFGPSAL